MGKLLYGPPCSSGSAKLHPLAWMLMLRVQGSLEELLEAAQAGDDASATTGAAADEVNFKGTAIVMSMRFHFANTIAKLREWPVEDSRVMASTPASTSDATVAAHAACAPPATEVGCWSSVCSLSYCCMPALQTALKLCSMTAETQIALPPLCTHMARCAGASRAAEWRRRGADKHPDSAA
jgi:hypothetical protein